MKLKAILIILIFILSTIGCNEASKKTGIGKNLNKWFYTWQSSLEESIVNDFFNPAVASRVYVYPNIALNQIINHNNKDYNIQIKSIPSADSIELREMTSLFAFYYTSKNLVFNSTFLDSTYEQYKTELNTLGYSIEEILIADSAGHNYANKILKWAATDFYKEMRSSSKHELTQNEGAWMPTPPDYFDGLEPHWGELHPLLLDSTSQFRATQPTPYSKSTKSDFFKDMQLLLDTIKTNTKEKLIISAYWDCNPMVLKHEGHATYSDKKLTPGGHWINIGLQVGKRRGISINQAAYVNAVVCTSIFDSFISCWETKYHYNYIRPVTAINKLIDPNWLPPITTPNFPEYTSGHSVISSSSAVVLTKLFGEKTEFIDSSEVKYGNEPRYYKSFFEAKEEAAISRLYAGIHFMPAIEKGKKQGEEIGNFAVNKLKIVKITPQ